MLIRLKSDSAKDVRDALGPVPDEKEPEEDKSEEEEPARPHALELSLIHI